MSDNQSSAISQIVDGATYVPRANPNDWYAVQIDLPEQTNGLHELFSLQLLVNRNGDTQKLNVLKPNDTLQLRFDGNSFRIRFVPCCLSAYVILGERYELDHYADPLELDINCLIRVKSKVQPLTGNEPWLVRGTLVSGAIKLRDPSKALLHRFPLSARLWPNGELINGLFLSSSQFQIEVENTKESKRRRLQFDRAIRDSEGFVSGAIWRQIAIHSLPGESTPTQDPSARIQEIFTNIKEIANQKGFQVESIQVEPTIINMVVDLPTPGQSERKGRVLEFLRPGLRLSFTANEATTRFTPGTMFIETDTAGVTSYRLTDHDEVDYFSQTGTPSERPLSPDATINWDQKPSLQDLRNSFLTSTSPKFPSEQTQLWQFMKLQPEDPKDPSSFQNRPPSWVRYEINPPVLLPEDQSTPFTRISSLSDPFQFEPLKEMEWKLHLDLPREVKELTPRISPVRLQCTLEKGQPPKIEFFAADVTLESPQMRLYQPALPDPLSVPNERNLDVQNPETLLYDNYRFVFRADPTTPDSLSSGLVAHWIKEPGAFSLESIDGSVTTYLPANRALIDPVSVTRGNLIGKTVISAAVLDLRQESHSVESVDFQEDITVIYLNETGTQLINPDRSNYVGLFSSWQPILSSDPNSPDPSKPVVVAEIVSVVEQNGKTEIKLKGRHEINSKVSYGILIGPPRLAIPRDPNHGLIPLELGKFNWAVPKNGQPTQLPELIYNLDSLRGNEVSSVMALLPWAEWGPAVPEWLQTGRVRLHHRNLVQEHSEFESSFEDRFPPGGPKADPKTGKIPSPLLPFADFQRAVRDRYTEASGNLTHKDQQAARQLRNWLPGATLRTDNSNDPLVSKLEYIESASSVFPKIELTWAAKSGPSSQTLQIRKATDPKASDNWLVYDVQAESLKIGSKPTLLITDASSSPPQDRRRVINSAAPLLFDRRTPLALAYAPLSDQGYVVLISRPTSDASLWISTGKEVKIPWENAVPDTNSLVTTAALVKNETVVWGIAGRDDGQITVFEFDGNKARRFDPHPTIPTNLGLPTSAAIVKDGDQPLIALVFRQGQGSQVRIIRHNGTIWTVENPDPNYNLTIKLPATCVALEVEPISGSKTQYHLVIGYENGDISRWIWTTGKWLYKEKYSHNENGTRTNGEEIHPIQSVAIDLDKDNRSTKVKIFSANGTRFVYGWGLQRDPRKPTLLEHATGVSSIALTYATNLDQRTDRSGQPHSSYLVTGAQDGFVRLWRITGQPVEERRYSAGDSAVQHVASEKLPFDQRSNTEAKPFRLAAATSDSTVHLWDGRSGEQLDAPPTPNPQHALDNLGILRKLPQGTHISSNTWIVQPLHAPDANGDPQKLYSVTVTSANLALIQNLDNYTDIRFSCEALKVSDDGTIVAEVFQEKPYYLGTCGFFSGVVAAKDSGLEVLNHWPRLGGMPIYVTRLRKLQMNDKGPEEMQFEAVLVNPDDLASGVDQETEVGDVPGFIRAAVAHQSLILITVDFSKAENALDRLRINPGSNVDWVFALNRGAGKQQGFSGKLSQLVGSVTLDTQNNSHQITISLEPKKCRGVFFGRLWPLFKAPEKLTCSGRFQSNNDQVEQLCLSATSVQNTQGSFTVSSRSNVPIQYQLGVYLGTNNECYEISKQYKLYADLLADQSNSGEVKFTLEETSLPNTRFSLTAQLEQGPYRCLLYTQDRHSEIALVLWNEGDLEENATQKRQLGAMVIRQTNSPSQVSVRLTGAGAPKVSLEGSLVAMDIIASQMDSKDNINWVRYRSETHRIKKDSNNFGQEIELLLEGHGFLPATGKSRLLLCGTLFLRQLVSGDPGLPAGIGFELQSPIRLCCVNRIKQDPVLKHVEDIALMQNLKINLSRGEEPEIVFPGTSPVLYTLRDTTLIQKSEIQQSDNSPQLMEESFLRLRFVDSGNKQLGITWQTLLDRDVPLDRDLEPSAVRRVPRQASNTLQVIHRQGSGTRLRYDLDTERFPRAEVSETAFTEQTHPKFNQRDQAKRTVRLSPVVSNRRRFLLLEESRWLEPLNSTQSNLITESLLVLFRPLSANNEKQIQPFVTVLENRTIPNEGEAKTQDHRYSELLRKTGAAGVALIRQLDQTGKVSFSFINSPFFSRQSDDLREFVVSDEANLALSTQQQNSSEIIVGGFDFRILRPDQVLRWSPLVVQSSDQTGREYLTIDRSDDPYRQDCCVPEREIRFHRASEKDEPEKFGYSQVPHIRLLEATAFRSMQPLFHLPTRGRRPGSDPTKPDGQVFLPRTIDVRFAYDKPGGMFHHLLQVQNGSFDDAGDWKWQLEPSVDYALREPQQIRVSECVTTGVKIKSSSIQRLSTTHDVASIHFVWDEVLGTVDIEPTLATASDPWIKVVNGAIRLQKSPLQMIVQFNHDVLGILPADPAVPAYEIEYQQGADVKRIRLLSKLFFVTYLTDITRHQIISDAEGTLEVVAPDPLQVKFPAGGVTPSDGDVIDIWGVIDIPQANRDRWRLLHVKDGKGTFYLTHDTVANGRSSNGGTVNFQSSSSGSIEIKQIYNTSPIIIELMNPLPDGQVFDSGDEVTIAGIEGCTAANGTWRILKLSATKFTLQKPEANTSRSNATGKWKRIRTRVKPYFQIFPNQQLTLNVTDGSSPIVIKDFGNKEDPYIRISESNDLPEAIGDWRIFEHLDNNNCYLHRVSFGNGKYVDNTGSVKKVDDTTLNITDATDKAPIVITTKGNHGLNSGTSVTIEGVMGNTAANGKNWRVRSTSETQFEIYHDSLAGNQAKEVKNVSFTRLVPLEDAYEPEHQQQTTLWKLKQEFDPAWGNEDRPLLQMTWAGRIDLLQQDPQQFLVGQFADLYEAPKQVKFLSPAQLQPKLAAVVVIPKPNASDSEPFALQRTILFGDSAPAQDGKGEIRTVNVNGNSINQFTFLVADNRETVIFGLPDPKILPNPPSAHLYLLKYLTTGVTVFDETTGLSIPTT